MKKLAVILMLAVVLTACTAVTPAAAPTGFVEAPDNVQVVPQEQATIPADVPVQEISMGQLTARIFSDVDATVINEPYLVQGYSNREVVVTVNEAIFTNPAESVFTLPVTLDEGPNLIEIVMSDLDGNEVSITLTVTFEP